MLGQALLAKRMGKNRVIAETGAGQHGVATATGCALLGLDCVIYMGAVDTARQALNVARMRLLGAEVVSVESGSQTLKDAINEAFRDWVTNADNTYYCFGTAAGPHPFPTMVRDFQRVIGLETRVQIQVQAGRLPDAVVACVGGGSNAIGIFHAFLDDPGVRLWGTKRRATASRPAGMRPHSPAARPVRSGIVFLPAAGRGRAGHRIPFDLSGSGLSGRWARARLAEGDRTGRVPADHRLRGHGGVRSAVSHRRHHPGHRVRACRRGRPQAGQ